MNLDIIAQQIYQLVIENMSPASIQMQDFHIVNGKMNLTERVKTDGNIKINLVSKDQSQLDLFFKQIQSNDDTDDVKMLGIQNDVKSKINFLINSNKDFIKSKIFNSAMNVKTQQELDSFPCQTLQLVGLQLNTNYQKGTDGGYILVLQTNGKGQHSGLARQLIQLHIDTGLDYDFLIAQQKQLQEQQALRRAQEAKEKGEQTFYMPYSWAYVTGYTKRLYQAQIYVKLLVDFSLKV